MRRSEINQVFLKATKCFAAGGWALPPQPRWDITDFGLGNFWRFGLTLINLAEEAEYCEKLMYAVQGQRTPCHTHRRKKEDIICRAGVLAIWIWRQQPVSEAVQDGKRVTIKVNGAEVYIESGREFMLPAGSRITLPPGIWHAFAPATPECIIGEVSTANDDVFDNVFIDPSIGRFPGIEEDEEPAVRLASE